MKSKRPEEELTDGELLEEIRRWAGGSAETAGILSVKEVALRYYPAYNPAGASRALRRSIRSYPRLERALGLVGWDSRHRSLTPLQFTVLAHYLGLP